MGIQLPETELEYRKALQEAAELGAKKALQDAGVIKPFFILAEAKRIYGASLIDFLVKSSLVKPIKDGPNNCRVRLDRIELESAVKTCNRAEYYKYLDEKEKRKLKK